MICVDANVLIALVTERDLFHDAAAEAVFASGGAIALNVTIAEALVHPHSDHRADLVLELFAEARVTSVLVTDEVADRASRLRAEFGNRHFPMLDALVVAHALENGVQVVTADDKWPTIADADVRILAPSPGSDAIPDAGA